MEAEEIIKLVTKMPSYILDDDIRLYHKYGSVVPNGGTIVDIGTGLGKSMVCLSKSAPQAVVYTFDNAKYMIGRGEAKDPAEYDEKIQGIIEENELKNVVFSIEDVVESPVKFDGGIDLLHVDCETGVEGKVLETYYPQVISKGIILVRNYNRFKDIADSILENCNYIERHGEIQVVEKL